MKKYFSILPLCLFISLIFAQCKKDKPVQPDNPPANNSGNTKVSYNKTDTSVSLQNGQITIDIPSGAMKEGTKISIGNSTVKFIDTAHVLYQFELKPAGTKFKKPVTLTFHYDSTWLKGNSPWNIGIAYKNDTDGKWYPAVNGDVDTVNHTISIKTAHFSHWSIYTCFHLYMKADQQLSEDNAQTISMQPGDIGLLLVTMDEPPAWKTDPDKSKEFSNPLVAPLTTPPIDPKESYSKSLAPDEWDVNGRVNGDEHVGKILPVSGAQEKLYQYLAPPEPPENNPVSISATIHTLNHGDIILIQPAEIIFYGYMPSPDIISEYYVYDRGGNTNSQVTSERSGEITKATVTSRTLSDGISIASKAIYTYDGKITTIKSYQPDSMLWVTYNNLRKTINQTPHVVSADTSLLFLPFSFLIPDQAITGDKIAVSGSVTMHNNYKTQDADGWVYQHGAMKTYNRNCSVEGYDSVRTALGGFWCLKISYDHVVTDSGWVESGPPYSSSPKIEKKDVFHTTEWWSRGIGIVKSKSHDPTDNSTTTMTISAIKREKNLNH